MKNTILFVVFGLVLLIAFPLNALAENQASQTITITANVGYSITGSTNNKIVYAATNWENGFWISKKDNSFMIVGKF